MEEPNQRKLIDGIRRGDERALRELIALHSPRLLRLIERLLAGNRAEAEDVLQETFIRFWRHRARLDLDANPRAYLFTIASNLCLNRQRGWRRAPRVEPLAEPGEARDIEAADASPNPERLAHSAQLGDHLRAEIAALPVTQRAALLLRHDGGLSYDEIAAVLETSPAAVESLLHRARSRLRERLRGWLTEGKGDRRGRRE